MLEIKASLEFFFFSHTAEGQHEQIVFLFVLLVRFFFLLLFFCSQ